MASVLDQITAYLTGKGFSRAQVAGIEGNFQIESGFNPQAYNPREGAIGLAQWEKGRRTALQNFARAHGGSETDLFTQLDYMWSELQGPERSALTAVLAANTPAEAAAAWDAKYERSSGAARQQRIKAADAIYSGGGVANVPDSTSSSGGTSTADVLGNIFVPGYGAMQNITKEQGGLLGGALGIGLKIMLTGTAVALVVVGAVKTVSTDSKD